MDLFSVPSYVKLQQMAILMVIIEIRMLKFFILNINNLIPNKFDEAVRRLKDIFKYAVMDDSDNLITISELKQFLKIQKLLQDAVYSLTGLFEIPLFALILENVIHFALGPGKLVLFFRWGGDDWDLTLSIVQFIDLFTHFLWVVVVVEPFHQISTSDEEMRCLLNDFLACCIEEGVDCEGFEELECAVEHLSAFPLNFTLIGKKSVIEFMITNDRLRSEVTNKRGFRSINHDTSPFLMVYQNKALYYRS
ncbi:hypothetical protein EVAR_31246_1 [Eumeta japonica]|uniref:Uncharacterized protein n=1 Tax=Eumeta variegata TaxID=151549 RepID=A0A4C1VZT9_EUMVA|nr:hypothetical protein EVAR_31246_1 [Eumeta japonica]